MIFTLKRRLTKAGLCVCVFSLFFCMFFWSLYVFHASSPPYTLKEEMNDESTKKYFQKKNNNNNNNSNNRIKQREN